MRTKKLARNTISSLIFQICTIISGFFLPRLILSFYGSEVNGLVNSITQFLAIISFLELGVGAVVQSSLYKPLADNNKKLTSKIIASAGSFFKKIGEILLVYVIILMLFYPFIAKQDFGHIYTATLIAAMSISSFAQYYVGVVDRLLLTADQKGYLQYNAQTITLVANTILCTFFILRGGSIHLVKLTTSLIYLARPIFLRWYVSRHYEIDRTIQYTTEPIKQKWNGIAQHVSAVVLDSTDSIVLTFFSTLANVSIYSIYHLVVYGIKCLFTAMTNGSIQALLGELWALQDRDKIEKTFSWTEWCMHTAVVLIFGCTGVLIIPFIQVYTSGVIDANYIQPFFAVLIVLANAVHCLRIPYHIMIKAGGHYKETQNSYIMATLINIVISVISVKSWGLVGVALGTLIAMVYHTTWMAVYNSKYLLMWPFKRFLKQIMVDAVTATICALATSWLKLWHVSYLSWVLMATIVFVIWTLLVILINYIVYKEKMMRLILSIDRKLRKKL